MVAKLIIDAFKDLSLQRTEATKLNPTSFLIFIVLDSVVAFPLQ